jgi:hypothetical protein
MPDLIITGYRRLFEVRILHHYWLDEGAALFDSLDEKKKEKRISAYDFRQFLTVVPTDETLSRIKALGGVFKMTSLGFLVAVRKTTSVADDEVFTFSLLVQDPAFYTYTALTLPERKIHVCYDPVSDSMLKFKQNTALFSNLSGTSRGSGPTRSLYLSKEIPAPSATDQAEYFNRSGSSLLQLSNSQPGADTVVVGASADHLPVFVNQNDWPDLVPPPGVSGTPEKGIQLTEGIPDQVYALIRITAVHPSDNAFSSTSGGLAKAAAPLFQLRFRNRFAVRTYRDKNTGEVISETPAPLPLSFYGNAGPKVKPGTSGIRIRFQDNDPAKRIEKIYTEIFE